MTPALAVALAALAASAGAAPAGPAETRVVKARVGERTTLSPPVTPGRGARWVELEGPDLLFRRGMAKGREITLRPRTPGRYRIAFLWGKEASLRDSPVVELDVEGPEREIHLVTGPVRAPGGEEVELTSEPYPKREVRRSRERWSWKQLSGPRLAFARGDLSGKNLRFTPELPGAYRFACRFTYEGGGTPWAVFTVELPRNSGGGPERRPVARVAPVARARVGDEVVLDGSRSADPDGGALVYRWTKLSGRPGKLVGKGGGSRESGKGARVRFFPAFPGEYSFALTVVDTAGFESTPARVALTVLPHPEPARADPDAADPLDRPFSIRLEDQPLSVLFSRLSDAGVTVRASTEVTESHPFDVTRIDLWAVDLPARKVLDWVGRVLDAFYVIGEPGVVWFSRGTRWLERERAVAATYRIDALYSEKDASDLVGLLREAVRGALWAGSNFSLGPPDLKNKTLTAILPKSAQSRIERVLDELRRDAPSGRPEDGDDPALGRLVRRPVRVKYKSWPARDVIWDLARQARVPVGFMPLGAVGGKRVSLDLGRLGLGRALDAVCRAAGLAGYVVEPPGAIWLSKGRPPPVSSECLWSAAEVRSYDVRRLRAAHGFAGPMVVYLVKSRVLSARWKDSFASVGYSHARRRLVVIHTADVQRAVAAFLARLQRLGEKALAE